MTSIPPLYSMESRARDLAAALVDRHRLPTETALGIFASSGKTVANLLTEIRAVYCHEWIREVRVEILELGSYLAARSFRSSLEFEGRMHDMSADQEKRDAASVKRNATRLAKARARGEAWTRGIPEPASDARKQPDQA